MGFNKNDALADIDTVIARQFTGSEAEKTAAKGTALAACLRRYVDENSTYWVQSEPFRLKLSHPNTGGYGIAGLRGILAALRADIDAGSLVGVKSVILAEVFADLLEQADHLAQNSYRRAAAVLAGATLEEHLRKLAARHAVATTDANGAPRKASALNADLYSNVNVYTKAENAQVDAWQKIRNDAAHGEATFEATYNDPDIGRMVSGIRDFIVKHPS